MFGENITKKASTMLINNNSNKIGAAHYVLYIFSFCLYNNVVKSVLFFSSFYA
jgi:hypothetical protein